MIFFLWHDMHALYREKDAGELALLFYDADCLMPNVETIAATYGSHGFPLHGTSDHSDLKVN